MYTAKKGFFDGTIPRNRFDTNRAGEIQFLVASIIDWFFLLSRDPGCPGVNPQPESFSHSSDGCQFHDPRGLCGFLLRPAPSKPPDSTHPRPGFHLWRVIWC